MGCVGLAGWFLLGVYLVTAKWPLGLKSSAGSTELEDIQDDFFNHKSGALAGMAKIAGCWPGIFVSLLSLPTWLVWASSKHGGLMVVRLLIWHCLPPELTFQKTKVRNCEVYDLTKEASFLPCSLLVTQNLPWMKCGRGQQKGISTGKQSTLVSYLYIVTTVP